VNLLVVIVKVVVMVIVPVRPVVHRATLRPVCGQVTLDAVHKALELLKGLNTRHRGRRAAVA
jgi:hypothetical protein